MCCKINYCPHWADAAVGSYLPHSILLLTMLRKAVELFCPTSSVPNAEIFFKISFNQNVLGVAMKLGLISALLVVTLAGCQQPPMPTPKYQIIPATDGSAWIIDTQNGNTWHCTNKMLGAECLIAKDLGGIR